MPLLQIWLTPFRIPASRVDLEFMEFSVITAVSSSLEMYPSNLLLHSGLREKGWTRWVQAEAGRVAGLSGGHMENLRTIRTFPRLLTLELLDVCEKNPGRVEKFKPVPTFCIQTYIADSKDQFSPQDQKTKDKKKELHPLEGPSLCWSDAKHAERSEQNTGKN